MTGRAQPGPEGATPDLFVWPPRALADEPILTDQPEDEPPTPIVTDGWLGRAEAELLGVRSVSFARWAARTGWRPDRVGSFCWRCAESVGPFETDGDGCGSCRGKSLAWDRASRLGVYEGGLRAGVTELKFGRWRRTGAEIGHAMGQRLGDLLAAGGFSPEEAVIVPVPSSWRRRVDRGIDHTAVLASAAGRAAGVRALPGLWRRHAPPQVGLSATARARNVKGAFGPTRALERAVAGGGLRAVVVLDDVRTTGATMTAACRAVRKVAGIRAEVWALTAVVASGRRVQDGPDRASGTPDGGGHEKIAKSFALAV